MEQITDKKAHKIIEKEKEKIRKIINECGKVIDFIIDEKDKTSIIKAIDEYEKRQFNNINYCSKQ